MKGKGQGEGETGSEKFKAEMSIEKEGWMVECEAVCFVDTRNE